MKKLTIMFLLLLVLVACSNENSTEGKKEENDNATTEQVEKKAITKEFVEKNAKVGLSYDEVRDIFGTEQDSWIAENMMNFIYDSTTYKPFTYNQRGNAVAFNELKSGKLDYQLYINFAEEKAVYYQYYFKGEDGEVWGYTVSSEGDNLSRNSGN